MALRLTAFALCLGASTLSLTAYAQNAPTTAPITDIRLSSGGLAEVRRQADVKENATVTLTIPLDQVDDVLKSLTVRDPKGTGSSASLAGKQPLAEVFKNLPFSASDLSSRDALLGSLQGAAVTVSGGGRESKGRIVGVERTRIVGANGEIMTKYRLAIFAAGKLVSHDLDNVDVTLDDESLRAKLEAGLNAVQAAKAGDARDISVSVSGAGARNVAIEYVVPAPIWKATYRLNLPKEGNKAAIQGWAVIENNSSDDWKNVRLSLSSGSPVTLHQRLHEAYYARRPEIPIYGPNGIVPMADKGEAITGRNPAEIDGEANLPSRRMAPAPAQSQSFLNQMARADAAGVRLEEGKTKFRGGAEPPPVETTESDISTVFTLPNAITLARGQSLTVRFLENDITANRVSVFQPQLGIQHPVAAVVIRNQSASSLPPGILTLTEEGSGYAGDAQLAGLPAGETRMVMFATDRKVQVATDTAGIQRLTKVVYSDGVLKADVINQTVTTYKIKGAPDADRTVIIEYPRRQGFTYTSEQKDSETPGTIRLKVNVPKGSVTETSLVEQNTVVSTYSLTDIENEGRDFAYWSMQATSDPQLAAKIRDASDALAKLNDAKRALSAYDEEVERIGADQQRIRENLNAVPATSDNAKSYLATMAAQEKRLTEIAALRAKGEDAVKVARAAFSEKLKAFQ